MERGGLMIIFDDNMVTLYKISDGEKIYLASFATKNEDYLSDNEFAESVKTVIAANDLEKSHIHAVLSDNLFYTETKTMPKLPLVLLYRSIKEELNCLFTAERMKNYSLKILEKKAEGKTVRLTFLLTPHKMIRKIKIFIKKLPYTKYEISKKRPA